MLVHFRKAVFGSTLALGFTVLPGCCAYRDIVDTCYPQRYWQSSREIVNQTFAVQVNNGHILDQTIWNRHFEAGTDKLNGAGKEWLLVLLQRRPHPDLIVYLQTARDIGYDPAAPERFVSLRNDLDQRRIQAVQQYMRALSEARGCSVTVEIHDPPTHDISGVPVSKSVQQFNNSAAGVLGAAGAGGSGGGGASGGR